MEIYIKDHWLQHPKEYAIAHLEAAAKLLEAAGKYIEAENLKRICAEARSS